MKRILCFGDSNTWGFVPGTKTGERYSVDIRWTGLLSKHKEEFEIIEEGLCGRTTFFDDIIPGRNGLSVLPEVLKKHSPLDAVIIMLGTNDCKTIFHATENVIGKGLESCLDEIEKIVSSKNIIVVSPIELGEEVWKPNKDPDFNQNSILVAKNLKDVYKKIAENRGNTFIDENGHKALAEVLLKYLYKL